MEQPAQTLEGRIAPDSILAWSPDGRLAVASYDSTVILWDLKTGQPTQTLKGHKSVVFSTAWSSDGRLASGSDDGTIILRDLKTGQPFQTLKGHMDTVSSVAWSSDGRLASSSFDQTIKIARADLISGDLCHNIFRNMTAREWLSLQGPLYVYRPACPNLPVPAFHPIHDILHGDIQSGLITWEGRLFVLGSSLLLLAILFGSFRILQKFVRWVGRKTKNQFGEQPGKL